MAMRATSVFRAACRACVGACVVVVVAVLGLVQVAPFSAQANEPGVSVFPVRGGGELLGSSVFAGDSGPAHADVKLELVVPRDALGASGFTYTATVSNQGPAGADGTRFSVEFEPGTSEISWECTPLDTTSSAPVHGEAVGSAGAVEDGGVASDDAGASGEGLSPEGTTPGSDGVTTVPVPGLGVAGRASFVGSGVSAQTSASRAQVFGADGGFGASVGPRSAETTGSVPTVNALASFVLDAGTVGVAPSVGAGSVPASGVFAESVMSAGRRGFVTGAGHSVAGSGYSGLGFGHGDMLGRAAVSRGAVSSAVFASADLGSSSASDVENGSEGVAPSVGAGSEPAAGVGGEGGPVVASCPVDVEIKEGASVAAGERPRLSGRIESLPVEGQVVFTLKGKFPNNKTSASAVFTAELPAGIVDDNPATNRVEQQTALTPVRPSIRVTKTQDKETTALGETRTYTVTYENTGDLDMWVSMSDLVQFSKSDGYGVPVLFSVSIQCDQEASTTPCPTGRSAEYLGRVFTYINNISSLPGWSANIPVGKKLVFKIPVTVSEKFCAVEAGDITVSNVASAHASSVYKKFASGKTKEASETVVGKILNVPACPRYSVRVSKVQDKEIVSVGEARTYTVTYENIGENDAQLHILDYFDFFHNGESVYLSHSYSVECDQNASTMQCDFMNPYERSSVAPRGHAWDMNVVIPEGKKLVLKLKMTIDEKVCGLGSEILVRNRAQANPSYQAIGNERVSGVFADGKDWAASEYVDGKVHNVPERPCPKMLVSITQDKELTAAGEPRTYNITYENVGAVDAKVGVGNQIDFANNVTSRYSYFADCDQTASTMKCPNMPVRHTFEQGTNVHFHSDVTIPAGKKLVWKGEFTVREEMCGAYEKDITLSNRAVVDRRDLERVSFAKGSVTVASIYGRVRCVDVSTVTTLSDYSPRVGEFVDVVSQVSNSAGLAEDVPFWLQLPVDDRSGRKVDVLSVDVAKDVVCEVEVGDGECPTGFTYDAQANAVVGVIPRLPLGSAVKIKARTLLTTGAKFLKTYDVFAQTPGIFADFHLGPEGSNRSSTTFSWSEIMTILIPDTPVEVEDPCGVGNAVWVKPEDTYTLRWEVTDQGHLVVYPQEGYVFEGGQVSHDFGVPVDSGQLCWIQPLAIPMTGGKAADTLYAAGLVLLVVAACGAGLKKRHNTRVRTYTAPH